MTFIKTGLDTYIHSACTEYIAFIGFLDAHYNLITSHAPFWRVFFFFFLKIGRQHIFCSLELHISFKRGFPDSRQKQYCHLLISGCE